MEGSRSRRRGGAGLGGGAAVSKKGAAGDSAYADVFGGPPRFAAPYATRLDDYAEIFGDLASTCSIPFLDIPPAVDGCDRGAGFDYSEVFGGLDFGEFAAPYEELFVAPKREEALTTNGRTLEEATCNQQEMEEFKFPPRHSNGDHMACQEGDVPSSNSNPSDSVSMQFNVLYNKTIQESKEGAMNGKMHTTQLHDDPELSSVIDTGKPFRIFGDDGPRSMLNDGIDDGKHQNKSQAMFSCNNSRSSENYSRADQRHSTNKYPVLENGHANASYHSLSLSSSISSGDVWSSDITYLTVSDINLRTQPVRVPPPSRPPPRLFGKQGHPKPRISSSPKIGVEGASLAKPVANEEYFHVHQEDVKDSSSSFFDVEVDASSAAAASAAAMKEAMELAQAKLRSAKELMEKKRDNLQNSKKLDHHESVKHKERKLGQPFTGQKGLENMLVVLETKNVMGAAKQTPLYEENKEDVVLTEEDGHTRLGSSKLHGKSADKAEKWNTNKEFYELVNSEKYKMTEEVTDREGSMKKTNIMTLVCEVKQNESEKDALAFEIESNKKLRKDDVAQVACGSEDNAKPEAHNPYVEEVDLPEVHNLHDREVTKTLHAGESSLFAGSEKKVEPSDNSKLHYSCDDKGVKGKLEASVEALEGENSFRFVEINGSKEEKGKSEAAKPQGGKYEKEINIDNIDPEPSKGGEKLIAASVTDAQEESNIHVPHGSCILTGETANGTSKCTDSKKRREGMQCVAEIVSQLEGTIIVHEPENREGLHVKQPSHLSTENELKIKVDQEAGYLEEDSKKWKSTVGAATCKEEEKLIKATKGDCWQDCNGNKANAGQPELEQRDKKENATPESCNLENSKGQKIYGRDLRDSGNEDIIEIQVEPHFMNKVMSMNAIPVICIRPLSMTSDVQPANLSEKGDNVSYLSLVAMESQPVASQDIILDIKEREEQQEKVEEESEQMEHTRKLEEEQEKERIQEEEKKRLLEEAKEMERKLEEEKVRARLLEEANNKDRRLKEEKERTKLLEEAKERERKLEEEKEQAKLLEEAKERQRKLEEEKERARLLEEEKERERKVEEERTRVLKEANERERKLEEEKKRMRLLEEAKEKERKLEEERTKILEEAKDRERKLEEEKERARLLEEEKEREREREKDRLAVERATREAHDRAFTDARERAERIAAERVTSEAWQRAHTREKAEKATSEALEKSLTEKAAREARLRAERAAVERATAEARERAVERALAEKAAADARERAERCNATSRDRTRKENVTEEHLRARDKDATQDSHFRSTGSSYQANSDSDDQAGAGESALRCKARLERHNRIAERAAKALAEKNMRDILAQREQAERNRLAEYLDADIKRWSSGKEGNLRALLSTLQYILSPESGWQPIPLTDVITASAVKKAYRKATLCVHPDKLQQRGANIQQKYVCEKVFDLLKEAWNRFNSEER
ncbi:unnamed protein product [Musa acuminata subsp. malaccensis]|uniref:(wild Malaysian banana) hypothetical protein n=1 Tax=Musa acuminata subsp. malaccensis TaxID=214687 RepID=A0A804ICT9_MUSAM|nr:PREDICTED: auxilin-like protein 1 isoform X1 [Musa acuminata subsp. malaccensis]CAG1850376.1 unnamed protein product [Musa acuminata subsp. malaccensis]